MPSSPVFFQRATHEQSQEQESARIDLWVVSRYRCSGAPRLVRIDELHSPEVLSSDCRRSLDSSSELFLDHDFNRIGVKTVLRLFLFFVLRGLTRVAPEFLIILGPGGFSP